MHNSIYKTRTILVAYILSLVTGGCALFKHDPEFLIADKLECYVAMGFRTLPDCPPYTTLPAIAAPGDKVQVILKAVYSDHLSIPIPNRQVDLEIVTVSGEPVTLPKISPNSVTTSTSGYNIEPITLSCSNIGVFRVKATYIDKRSKSVSYSKPIIVSN